MKEAIKKFDLVTRSDFDGMVCAILLKQLDLIDGITFVHPKDVQDGKIDITAKHITTNLPYSEKAHLSFDHHASESLRVKVDKPNRISQPDAPSTARVVFDHFGGKKAFPRVQDELLAAVDKSDSASFSMEDVLEPTGWVLLSFLLDPRTGLGRFKDFHRSNYQLMMDLIDHGLELPVEDILKLPEVIERTDLYFNLHSSFKQQITRCSTVHEKLVVLDLRGEETIYPGNRFMIYALFPGCNISMHALWGLNKLNTVFAVGKSIFDRSSKIHIGHLMFEYGGGGHDAAGTCQISNERSARIMEELINRIVS